jgi:GNAT superfamily N-acetyltransferase
VVCTSRPLSGLNRIAVPVVSRRRNQGDYGSVGRYPFALRLGMPGDLAAVSGLVREAAEWLRTNKNTDQWAKPWPDRIRRRERMLNDLLKGKTWLVWDGETVAATITVDTDEPVDLTEQPVWPEHERHQSALYVRRIVVARGYAGRGLGAALLDWAADVAKRDHKAALIRIDVWTTNLELHAYYERQRFVRLPDRDPASLPDYPSRALFEREADLPGSDYTRLFLQEERNGAGGFRLQGHLRIFTVRPRRPVRRVGGAVALRRPGDAVGLSAYDIECGKMRAAFIGKDSDTLRPAHGREYGPVGNEIVDASTCSAPE